MKGLDRIQKTVSQIRGLDADSMRKAKARLDRLTKPTGSLGRLEDLAQQVCGIKGNALPSLKHKVIFTLAGDHGVTREKVSPFPREVTAQMVYNFLSGGAGINVLAQHVGARVVVADLGVAATLKPHPALVRKKISHGTRNMAQGAAMTKAEAIASIVAGIEIFEEEAARGIDIAGTGEMGIGNTTPSSAITACITGKPADLVTGRGAGLDDKGLTHKIEVVKRALLVNKPDPSDPIDVLSKVGGFEIGGLTGIILAASAKRVPVVIDGFISGAAALVAAKIAPLTKSYMIAAHLSVENGHRAILEYLGLRPLLDLGLRLGEGTGSALGIGIVDAALKIFTQMATFKEAGVSERAKR